MSEPASLVPLFVIAGYLALLLGLGVLSGRFFKGTSADYFVVSRTIGPFLLLMSIFGTTRTGFALVGSTGKAYTAGIGVAIQHPVRGLVDWFRHGKIHCGQASFCSSLLKNSRPPVRRPPVASPFLSE